MTRIVLLVLLVLVVYAYDLAVVCAMRATIGQEQAQLWDTLAGATK